MVAGGAGVDAASGGQDDGALAGQQALRAGRGVLERDASAQHMVQPGLEGAGDGEVVHRCGHHQHIGRQQFIGQFVGSGQGVQFGRAALFLRLHPATEQVGVQVRHRGHGQVAHGDLVSRVGSLPLLDEVTGQLTGNGILLAGAAFDDQYAGHGVPPSAKRVAIRWR
ncbi:hypothetical protein D3C79_763190 [compost metagenome]